MTVPLEAFDCERPAGAAARTSGRGLRFLLVGGFNTAFGYACFVVLHLSLGQQIHYLGSLFLAHVLSVLVAFVLYRTLVFRVRGRLLGDLWRFWSVYLVALSLNAVTLPLLVEGLDLPVILAQALVLGATVAMSFVGHSRFSFRRPK
jgi:putative flippase GtrA